MSGIGDMDTIVTGPERWLKDMRADDMTSLSGSWLQHSNDTQSSGDGVSILDVGPT